MIIALAGRRIDEKDSETPRFPLSMKETVRSRILACLRDQSASLLISSAACGADLLAQDAAGELKISRQIILPFDRARFRTTSVIDRPGKWGPLFDRICDEVEAEGNLKTLDLDGEDEAAYSALSMQILDHAQTIDGGELKAIVVWDRRSRGDGDESAAFLQEAIERKIKVVEIDTLSTGEARKS